MGQTLEKRINDLENVLKSFWNGAKRGNEMKNMKKGFKRNGK